MKHFILPLTLILTISVHSQDLVFKDKNFEKAVLEHQPIVDLNGDGKIQKAEADAVKSLSLMEQHIQFADDSYLFVNLEELVLTNNDIESLQLIGLKNLKILYCAANKLKLAEIRNLPEINTISLNFNQLDSLILDSIPKLKSLSAEDNLIREVDLSEYRYLESVDLVFNKLTQLDISKNPKIKTHTLYFDPTVKLIATPKQEKLIAKNGLGIIVTEMPGE